MVKTVFILSMIVFFSATGFARDPLYAPDEYGDEDSRQVSGGSKWTSGDTFLAITLPLAIIVTIALPHIFDGKSISPPMWWQSNEITFCDLSISSTNGRKSWVDGFRWPSSCSPSVPRWRMAIPTTSLWRGRPVLMGVARVNGSPDSPGLVTSADTRAKFPTRSQ